MNNAVPHWSQTSARLLNACPRSWVLTYAHETNAPSQKQRRRRPASRRPRTFDEAQVQCMRTAWLERMQDQFLGKTWSTLYLERRLQYHLDEAVALLDRPPLPLHITMALHRGVGQLKRLENTLSLRPLFGSKPHRWAYFDRREGASFPRLHLYAAPDVAVHHQHRWTLVRIQFRSPSTPLLSQELEHRLMVHWAMSQPGFPNDWQAYRVKVVRWHINRWIEHTVQLSAETLGQAMGLVQHDVQEMKWLQRTATADPSLSSVPLAGSQSTCYGCQHRPTCPAKDGLRAAKNHAEKLKTNQSEETKSARTA